MRNRLQSLLIALLVLPALAAAPTEQRTAPQVLSGVISRITTLLEPAANQAPQTFSAKVFMTRAQGLPKELANASADIALQAPDHLLLTVRSRDDVYSAGRAGQQLWLYTPSKKFGVIGLPDVPRFTADPKSIEPVTLPPIALPISREQIALLSLLLQAQSLPAETIDGETCDVIRVTAMPALLATLGITVGQFDLAVRPSDSLPVRIRYNDGKVNAEIALQNARFDPAWPAEKWQLKPAAGDTIEKTALSHLTRFITTALSNLNAKIPTLGPATGQRTLVATSGAGRLEMHDGTRVLFLKGNPVEMGHQHGTLLKKEIRDCTDRILYGVGVGSSFPKGRWFFGEIEQAHARLAPFISKRTYEELDALAAASGMHPQEARLANFFPELFHCSGFALCNAATADGKLYHGRILDYLRGVGLEQNAVVIVYLPDVGNAWVNISYAGFIGSVTAMNEKHISIGEMGGRGEGNWDGKPMAQLVREVMEKAGTLEEAVAIMQAGPRTCEYYYVISDGKTNKAVGIKATPTIFETVALGQSHPQLPKPVKDTVLLSAGDRYEHLVKRVQDNYGKFDATSALALMDPPVCMTSNIHSVLFAPATLDFWVANADSNNVASRTRYTKYNLGELLKSPLATR